MTTSRATEGFDSSTNKKDYKYGAVFDFEANESLPRSKRYRDSKREVYSMSTRRRRSMWWGFRSWLQQPMNELMFKFGFIMMVWILFDSLIFYAISIIQTEEDWSFAYALWFSTQAGFGVGWVDGSECWWARVFTMVHCLIGNFIVMSAMELLIIHKARAIFEKQAQQHLDNEGGIRIWTRLEFCLLIAWISWLMIGAIFARTCEHLSIAAAFLSAVTDLTTAGLIPPSIIHSVEPSLPLFFGTVYLLLGVPLTAALGTAVWAKIFAKYERRQKRRMYLETLLSRRLSLSKGASESAIETYNNDDRYLLLQFQRRAFSLQLVSKDNASDKKCQQYDDPNQAPISEEWALFLENELIQTGLVDRRLIAEIRLSFLAVDKAIVASSSSTTANSTDHAPAEKNTSAAAAVQPRQLPSEAQKQSTGLLPSQKRVLKSEIGQQQSTAPQATATTNRASF